MAFPSNYTFIMKLLTQNNRSGRLDLTEVPVPKCKPGHVLVQNTNSLISVGTERSIIMLGRQNLIGKAKSRPEQFKRAMGRARSEGFLKVWKEAMILLDDSKALGYSSSGIVTEVGYGESSLKVGDRVACIGAGYASHAEMICLPSHLCVKIPEGVSFEEAAFGMLGTIATQGILCAEVRPGQKVAVLGLGLLGQITVQLLKTRGCFAIGTDIQPEKLKLAESLGCDQTALVEDLPRYAANFTDGAGVDKIIITAAAKDNSLITLSAEIARFRAKIVLVGVVDIQIPREIFWEKELEFQVSKAGGYDPLLAKAFAYDDEYRSVSQQDNLEAFLGLIAENKIEIEPLITHRFDITESLQSYRMITSKNNNGYYLGVLLSYNDDPQKQSKIKIPKVEKRASHEIVSAGFIGAGMFSKIAILPILKKHQSLILKGVATTKGNTSWHAAKRFGFNYYTTDYQELLSDDSIQAVFIMTRHDTHAKLIKEAFQAKKDVFVEKPLATRFDDLQALYRLSKESEQELLVGFNRRFSRLARKIKDSISESHFPLVINIQVNAGNAPPGHWVFDGKEGGKRIIGEVCHFVDFAQYITGSVPDSVFTQNVETENSMIDSYDNTISVIRFRDGSICNILYASIGNRSFSREKITVFDNGAIYELDNFRRLKIFSPGKKRTVRLLSQDMGYNNEMNFFIQGLRGQRDKISELREGYFWTTLTTFKMMKSLESKTNVPINIDELA